MPPSVGIVAHVRCASKAGEPSGCDRGGVRIAIHLQRRPDERIDRVLSGKLAEHTVGAQAAVPPGEENIGARADVVVHAHLAAERVDALHPATFDGRYQSGVRVEREVFADLAAKSQ